jgi:hypothetical protein
VTSARFDDLAGRGAFVLDRLSTPGARRAAGAACLTALTLIVFARHVFAGWTFPWDFLGTYTATPPFVGATVGTGHFISWTPFVASGFPVAVDPQAELYYPIWWLFGLLRVPLTLTAVTDVQVAHVLFGALGMLALARARRVGWPWALAAAVGYLFFGGFYGQAEHADIFRGFAYLPWVLWTLTPPLEGTRWIRLFALPPLTWLIAAGAYPGQLVSFAVIGAVYVIVALATGERTAWRRYRAALVVAAASAAAVCLVVLLPYLLATHHHELYRAFPPTAAVRAGESIAPVDFFGLYLNSFAWQFDGTVTAWAIGIPVLIGLGFVRMPLVRRHLPLVACGIVALVLAMTPKIGPVGRAMASLGFLFPSRFPASDYKAAVIIAVLVLSVEAWAGLARRRPAIPWPAVAAGALLIVGVLVAPDSYGPLTRTPWLLVLVVGAAVVLAWRRPAPTVLATLLIGLLVVDGIRDVRDIRQRGITSSWQAPASEVATQRRLDAYIRRLPGLVTRTVDVRPARIPPAAPVMSQPTGSDTDSFGWVGDGYHLIDYSATIETSLRQAELSPVWTRLLLSPWHAYLFPCATAGCSPGPARLPSPTTWRASPAVRTVSYGAGGITYDVDVSQPMLMVENELALSGWRANTTRVRLVRAGVPLRAWRLSPGHYQFTATYHQAGSRTQALAAAAAVTLWLASGVLLGVHLRLTPRRRRREEAAGSPPRETARTP